MPGAVPGPGVLSSHIDTFPASQVRGGTVDRSEGRT